MDEFWDADKQVSVGNLKQMQRQTLSLYMVLIISIISISIAHFLAKCAILSFFLGFISKKYYKSIWWRLTHLNKNQIKN